MCAFCLFVFLLILVYFASMLMNWFGRTHFDMHLLWFIFIILIFKFILISTTYYTYIYVKCCCCFLQLISILVLYCSIELHSIGPSKIKRLLYHSLDRVFEMDIHSYCTYTVKLRDFGMMSKFRLWLKMVFKAPKHTMFCNTKINFRFLLSN